MYSILLSIYVGSITIASVLSNKIIDVYGLYVPAGVLAYSVTFIVSDVISEIWGKEVAKKTVFGGFVALFVVIILVHLGIYWPKAPFWEGEKAFNLVLGSSGRIILASFIAYFVSQYHDVWAFHFLKKLTWGRHLWLRNNLSTIVSQFIDSSIFIFIAFFGELPVIPMIFGQWVVKIGIAVVDTPIVYLLCDFVFFYNYTEIFDLKNFKQKEVHMYDK
jgi:hypothetical protein